MYSNKTVIIQILQGLKKLKNKILIKKLTLIDIRFLDFLWKNNIIYGYTISYVNHITTLFTLFLKYNKIASFSSSFFMGKNIKYIVLRKEKIWAKNTFLIVSSKVGFFSNKDINIQKIGGFLLGKFF
jgi:hypothetical protein